MVRKRAPSSADIGDLFDRLLDHYGPRNWWPADSPFEVIVGAILTQNTAWGNVEKALSRMREAGVWSLGAVRATPRERLAEIVRPSGYYNQKARKLHVFAEFLHSEFDGSLDALFALDTGELRERLIGLWGIGEETADDIVLYAAGKPSFVVDAYTVRLVERLGWRAADGRYADYQALFTDALPLDAPLFNEYHALIDRHSSTTCRKEPACPGCPLLDVCPTGRERLRHTADMTP